MSAGTNRTDTAGPVAIVTGISRGFGNAVARVLLDAGWIVVGDARDAVTLEHAATALPHPENLEAIPGDATTESHIQELCARANERGRLELVVNSAGALGPSPLPRLLEVDVGELRDLFWVNTISPIRLLQIAVPSMRDGGTVINVTSDASVEHYEGWGAYGATKAAVDLLTGVLAVEAPHLRFYALDPGDMRTAMHQAAFPGEDISDRAAPEERAPAVLRLLRGDLPSGRYRASDLL
jgi:NAD(P)-dependent dehydrogenase (short-subunit alcohol dehydrogenase family)